MRATLAIVLVCLLVTACGGGGGDDGHDPVPVPSATSTPPPAPTPTVTVTPEPAAGPLAWAAGSNRLLRSDDGGFTWSPDPVVAVGDAVDFVDRAVGWVAGSTGAGGTLLHTTDGGRSWTQEAVDFGTPPPFFHDIDAIDHDRAVVAGSENRLAEPDFHRGPPAMFFTNDAGTTWRRSELVGLDLFQLREVAMLSVCLTASGDGIAFGSDLSTFLRSLLLVTHDGGATWEEPPRPPPISLFAKVACVGEHDLWVAGDGLFHSADAGATWHDRSFSIPHPLPLAAIAFETPLDGRIVGFVDGRLVLLHTRDGGEHWTSGDLTVSTGLVEVVVGMDFHGDEGVIVLEDDHALVIPRAEFGIALATRDGGRTWTETVFPEPINALWDVALIP